MRFFRVWAGLLTTLAFAALLGLTPQTVLAQGLEYGVDRPGLDYKNFNLPAADPNLCRDACAGDPQCRAFTFVRPGYQGPSARCWLKNQVPNPVDNSCCVSGVRSSPPPSNTLFNAPMFAGYAVDICLHWGQACGKPAADEFCRRQGFAESVSHAIQNDTPPTLVLGDNTVCDLALCDRFSAITCRPN
jgi:hypothetical protein